MIEQDISILFAWRAGRLNHFREIEQKHLIYKGIYRENHQNDFFCYYNFNSKNDFTEKHYGLHL